MAVTWAYRGTQTKAWYSTGGSAMGAAYFIGSTVAPHIASNVTSGVFGSSVLQLGNQGVMCSPIWPGFSSTPNTGAIAILMRIVPY
jgi:hypothetical protein